MLWCKKLHTSKATEWILLDGRLSVYVYRTRPRMWGIEYHPDFDWREPEEDERLMDAVRKIVEKVDSRQEN
jgi:hypothetical protein